MSLELHLRFPVPDTVLVKLDEEETEPIPFESPITGKDLGDIRWYLETYAAKYTTKIDDQAADRIAQKLPGWGTALFEAVFGERAAARIFDRFQDQEEEGRILTLSASHPQVLSLPWELLRDPNGTYLVHERPRVTIRRRWSGSGRKPFRVQTKERVRVLMVVSRPEGAGFLDPRVEAEAVLRAAQRVGDRVEVEFLRPATLVGLNRRLEDRSLPGVDILHFDGHGVFDPDGRWHEKAKGSDPGAMKGSDGSQGNMGYLLFEDEQGREALVSAETVGDLLNRQKIGLVVLSACQSAKVEGEDPSGCVAARLTKAGIPSVVAMTYSVLAVTAWGLFEEFYRGVVNGMGPGVALETARRYLYLHQDRGQRQREDGSITLKLQDWFLPALYQVGADRPLLSSPGSGAAVEKPVRDNLPERQEAGFFGRARELWWMERAFAVQGTRRMTLSGFGGQGKTTLAVEAGRWFLQTGLFEWVCFVDYSRYQGSDPVEMAVETMRSVLQENLIDAAAVRQCLEQRATLVILDNLEVLDPDPLHELLTVAKGWSEAGSSRVLITTRQPDLGHPDYPTQGSWNHQSRALKGLDPGDALAYLQQLMKVPSVPQQDLPEDRVLMALFAQVQYHPLAIKVLAGELKVRRPAELGSRLEVLVREDPENPLLASLNLSLERLDPEVQRWIPRLGVFQGGAMEDVLLGVTGLGRVDEDTQVAQARQLLVAMQSEDPLRALLRLQGVDIPEDAELPEELVQDLQQLVQEQTSKLAEVLSEAPQSELAEGVTESTWQAVRQGLEATGLIQPERIPQVTVPYLKFHPALAPALWSRLDPSTQQDLLARHRQRYYQLSRELYFGDDRNPLPTRAIAQRELPNLLVAVNGSLAAGDPEAVDFVDNVNRFLKFFGLTRDQAALSEKAVQAGGEVGSQSWYLAHSNQGEQLFQSGRIQAAAQVFQGILEGLGPNPSYERCLTLNRLGRCLMSQNRSADAATLYRQALTEIEQLPESDAVKRQKGSLQTDLADFLTDMGDYAAAREAYEGSLAIKKELGGEDRGVAVVNGQLGTLALLEGNLAEAAQRHQEALPIFRRMGEPAGEAIAWHNLGIVYQRARQWEESEHAYRESARIKGSLGNLAGAAQSWSQLADVLRLAGKPAEAELWYRKSLEARQTIEDQESAASVLNNLADLLQSQPERLSEARQLAEQSLAITQTQDPNAAEIWTTYDILADILEKQQDPNGSAHYRRLARQARFNFPGTRYQLKFLGPVILGVVAAVQQPELKEGLDPVLSDLEQRGWTDMVASIRRILNGERDEDALCAQLDHWNKGAIIMTILRGLEDPGVLQGWIEEDLEL